jgi:hypothetical protein
MNPRLTAVRWWRPTMLLLTLTALAFALIEVAVVQEGDKFIVPLAVIGALDLLLAGAMLVLGRAWLVLPALLLLVVGFIGDVPHQASVIGRPEMSGHFVFAVVDTVIQIAAIVVAALCAVSTIRRRRPAGSPA